MNVDGIINQLEGVKLEGYDLTLVFDMQSVGGFGVKTITQHFESEEVVQKEADLYEIGKSFDIPGEGVRAILHDKMITATYSK